MGQGGFHGVRSRLATPISLCPASCLKPRPLDKPRPPLPSSQRVGRCGERYGALWGLWGSMGSVGLCGSLWALWGPWDSDTQPAPIYDVRALAGVAGIAALLLYVTSSAPPPSRSPAPR